MLNESGVPFLVGGAYALAKHAGIERHTKDLDIFVRRAATATLILAGAGGGRLPDRGPVPALAGQGLRR